MNTSTVVLTLLLMAGVAVVAVVVYSHLQAKYPDRLPAILSRVPAA